jgi:hypothetical protein
MTVETLLIVILAHFNHKYIYSLLAKRRGSSTTRRKARRRNARSPQALVNFLSENINTEFFFLPAFTFTKHRLMEFTESVKRFA